MEEEHKEKESSQTKPQNDIKPQSELKDKAPETLVRSLICKRLSVVTSLWIKRRNLRSVRFHFGFHQQLRIQCDPRFLPAARLSPQQKLLFKSYHHVIHSLSLHHLVSSPSYQPSPAISTPNSLLEWPTRIESSQIPSWCCSHSCSWRCHSLTTSQSRGSTGASLRACFMASRRHSGRPPLWATSRGSPPRWCRLSGPGPASPGSLASSLSSFYRLWVSHRGR